MEPHYYKELCEEAIRAIEARRQLLPVAHDPALSFYGAPAQAANSAITAHAAGALYEGRAVLRADYVTAEITGAGLHLLREIQHGGRH